MMIDLHCMGHGGVVPKYNLHRGEGDSRAHDD